MGKQVLSVDDILKAAQSENKVLNFKEDDCIITPGAWDKIEELGLRFIDGPATDLPETCTSSDKTNSSTPEQNLNYPAIDSSSVESITEHICTLLQNQLPSSNKADVEHLIRQVVEKKLSSVPAAPLEQNSVVTRSGDVSLINSDMVFAESIDINIPGKVSISDAIRCHEDSSHATTYMQWEKSSFNRTLDAPEIDLIIEGELELTIDEKTLKAKAGDVLYINKGATVIYSAPASVKLACVNL